MALCLLTLWPECSPKRGVMLTVHCHRSTSWERWGLHGQGASRGGVRTWKSRSLVVQVEHTQPAMIRAWSEDRHTLK